VCLTTPRVRGCRESAPNASTDTRARIALAHARDWLSFGAKCRLRRAGPFTDFITSPESDVASTPAPSPHPPPCSRIVPPTDFSHLVGAAARRPLTPPPSPSPVPPSPRHPSCSPDCRPRSIRRSAGDDVTETRRIFTRLLSRKNRAGLVRFENATKNILEEQCLIAVTYLVLRKGRSLLSLDHRSIISDNVDAL
jgi:hypothetical protein